MNNDVKVYYIKWINKNILLKTVWGKDGLNVKSTNYNADGSVEKWSVIEYNEEGLEVKNTSYNADGSVSQWSVTEYIDF